jgi:hypothetical protein
MNKKAIIAIIVVVVLIIGFTVYMQFFGGSNSASNQSASVLDGVNQGDVRVMTALHQFRNGQHTIAGKADLPTPCHNLAHEVAVTGTNPQQAMVSFTTSTNNSDICAQVITSKDYTITFNADQNAAIRATWNGAPVQLNLVPVPAGENINDYEMYIKG